MFGDFYFFNSYGLERKIRDFYDLYQLRFKNIVISIKKLCFLRNLVSTLSQETFD